MDYNLIGSSCGEHGPYTFYKAFKYTKNNVTNILAVSEFFFVKLWPDSDLISIGELQLLWTDKNHDQTLASLRLYILPENTPEGRSDIHGEDEVLAITEKVVLRLDDLLTWIHVSPDWHWGQSAIWTGDTVDSNGTSLKPSISTDPPIYPKHKNVDMQDIILEKQKLGARHWETTPGVVVLSYPKYCRFRGLQKRLEGVYNKWLRNPLIQALGGFTTPCKNTRVLFCKDTFDYPDLEVHELLCNHLAPKLKKSGKKKKKELLSASEGEEEENSASESDSSASTSSSAQTQMKAVSVGVKPRLRCTLEVGNRVSNNHHSSSSLIQSKHSIDGVRNYIQMDEKKFLQGLHSFMRARSTPIGRIPVVGFKEVNLYKLYRKVMDFGGYDKVTTNKMWKQVYQITGGDMSCTSAATLSRRHYEKLLLPYERFLRGKAAALVIPSSYSLQQQARLGSSVKISPMRNNLPMKPAVQVVKQEKVGEKENIPERMKRPSEIMLNSSVTIIKKEIKEEVVDLVSPQSSPKASVTVKPNPVKKQKLDALKQAGLEVTPVALSSGSLSRDAVTIIEKPAKKEIQIPVQQPAHSNSRSKVSMTVTPDISHLTGGGTPVGNGSGKRKEVVSCTPDMSHLMYPWGVMTMNGPGPSKQKPNSVNPAMYRNMNRGNAMKLPVQTALAQPSSSAPIDLRMTKKQPNIGNNLQISLIPTGVKKSAISSSHVGRNQHRPQQQRAQPSPRFNAPIYTLKSSPNSAPFVPLIDPAFLCGNIVTQKLPNFSAPNPATSTPASINSFYKDLLRSQGIYNLLPDGSTSISLVGGQSTPTSK